MGIVNQHSEYHPKPFLHVILCLCTYPCPVRTPASLSLVRCQMVRPDVTPNDPFDEQPVIGLIGMGEMGKMYAKHLSKAGWMR